MNPVVLVTGASSGIGEAMNTFEKNIIRMYREKGKAWLAELPTQVAELEVLWGLSNLKQYQNLSYNYVLHGYQGEKPIVLKVSLDALSLDREARALEAFSGYGAVSVLGIQNNALLLQRLVPGKSLQEHVPQGCLKAIEIACHAMKKLHRAPVPQEGHFPHIRDWLSILDKDWSIPSAHIQRARKLKQQLLQTHASPVLLHGDLHRDNILSNGDCWVVIDPKGVIGFPINEVWACVEEPHVDLEYISKYFNFKFDDVVQWYYVHLVLAACWQIEDALDPKRFLDLAQSITPMITE